MKTWWQRLSRNERDAFVDRLRAAMQYDPETGVFTLLERRGSAKAGDILGSKHSQGYVTIGFEKRNHMAHRLAWIFMTGEFPALDIDHKDLVRSNNRWGNLRIATRSQNIANSRPYGAYPKGVALVSLQNVDRYRAQIRDGGRIRYLGLFDTPEEAHAAYWAVAKELHGEFARAA